MLCKRSPQQSHVRGPFTQVYPSIGEHSRSQEGVGNPPTGRFTHHFYSFCSSAGGALLFLISRRGTELREVKPFVHYRQPRNSYGQVFRLGSCQCILPALQDDKRRWVHVISHPAKRGFCLVGGTVNGQEPPGPLGTPVGGPKHRCHCLSLCTVFAIGNALPP